MSSKYAIEVNSLGKCYQIYEKPSDRLKQMMVRGRKKFYKEFWALKDVSFKIKKGETVGIIGRNGSGKSTLLQMICGTLNLTAGEVEIHGRVAALLELGAGFNPEFSGVENVYMAASLYGLKKEEVDKRFSAIAEFAGIGEYIYQPVKTYSSGMYVRLAFAVIAYVDADVLVIDEALAVGDAVFTQKCMRFLRSFMETGTVLFVSHDTSAVINLCSHAIWLDEGRIRGIGKAKDVCNQYLEGIYEEQQGRSKLEVSFTSLAPDSQIGAVNPNIKGMINEDQGKGQIELLEFKPGAAGFGAGGAEILNVLLQDKSGNALSWISGGEYVELVIKIKCNIDINAPIVGFFVKDRLGQSLFGDNTYLTYEGTSFSLKPGQFFRCRFGFQMPRLPIGDYSITVAVANGSQINHIQHHWIHDAVVFKSHSSCVTGGLIGIPMSVISLET